MELHSFTSNIDEINLLPQYLKKYDGIRIKSNSHYFPLLKSKSIFKTKTFSCTCMWKLTLVTVLMIIIISLGSSRFAIETKAFTLYLIQVFEESYFTNQMTVFRWMLHNSYSPVKHHPPSWECTEVFDLWLCDSSSWRKSLRTEWNRKHTNKTKWHQKISNYDQGACTCHKNNGFVNWYL